MDWLVRVIDVIRLMGAIRCLTLHWIDWIGCLDLIDSIGFGIYSIGDDWLVLINLAEWIGHIAFIRLAWAELVLNRIMFYWSDWPVLNWVGLAC